MSFRFRDWAPVFVWASLIFALSSIPDLQSGFASTWDLILRKIAHMAEYAILALLLLRAFKGGGRLMIQDWLFAFLVASTYSVSDEIHQSAVQGRHGSLWDIGIDTLGVLLGLFFFWFLYWRKKMSKATEKV